MAVSEKTLRLLGLALCSFESAEEIANALGNIFSARITANQPLSRGRAVNATTSAWPVDSDHSSRPSGDSGLATGDSWIELATTTDDFVQNSLKIIPFGGGNDGTKFNLRVIALELAEAATGSGQTDSYIETNLCEVECVLTSDAVGRTGGVVPATNKYCDIINYVSGAANVSLEIMTTGDGSKGHLVIDVKGAPLVALRYKMIDAVSGNALVKVL